MAQTFLNPHVEQLELSENLKHLPMIAMYDEAFRKLISQVFAGHVVLAPTDRAFELYINESGDKLKFPFISIFPTGDYNRVNVNFAQSHIGDRAHRQAIVYDDDTIEKVGVSKKMQNFYQVMYFNIPYTIVCWSNNRVQALQLVQELLFWLDTQGKVKVQYKDQEYDANLVLGRLIKDDSGYTDYANIGNIYRFSITINIEAPVIRTQNYLNISSIPFNLKLTDDMEKQEKVQEFTEVIKEDLENIKKGN